MRTEPREQLYDMVLTVAPISEAMPRVLTALPGRGATGAEVMRQVAAMKPGWSLAVTVREN